MQISLPALDARLTAPCARPVALEGEQLTAAGVQQGWARDRVALLQCGQRQAAIVSGYENLRQQVERAGQ